MKFLISLLIVLSLVLPVRAQADDIYTIVVKKNEDKHKYGFWLSDWIETRDKMRLMDLWLALHSPSPYEFYLQGDYQFPRSGNNFFHVSGAAFASIFGLAAERDFSSQPETLATAHLRVFGYHDQGTNLTLVGGLNMRDQLRFTHEPVGGAALTAYLTRFFGVNGTFRRYFESGNRYEVSPFIDFKALRIFGSYVGTNRSGEASSTVFGTRLYF
ncbi:hypothetical protein WDW86_07075 [Bdellovibrionota bacterium FG-2]